MKTNERGEWFQEGFEIGARYKVTPSRTAITFSPEFRRLSSASSTQLKDIDFLIPDVFSVSGRVLEFVNIGQPRPPLAGVLVSFRRENTAGPVPAPVSTDAGGQWRQSGFLPNVRYLISYRKPGFTSTTCPPFSAEVIFRERSNDMNGLEAAMCRLR